MFLPLHDDTVLKVIRFQYVTGMLLVANVAIFLFTHYAAGGTREAALATGLGTIPALITANSTLDPALRMVADEVTLVSYMFIHGGWLHLASNMAFLWVFADNIEDAFGHVGFLLFYLVCGVMAGLAHIFMVPTSQAPLIGASGAVAGILAAYLVLFPKARVWVLLFMRLPMRIPAFWVLTGWFVLQVLALFATQTGKDVTVAFAAHVGGFLAGLSITLVLRARLNERLDVITRRTRR